MNGLPVLLVTIVPAPLAANVAFEIELWPGEGRPRFVAVATTLQPRVTPSNRAAARQPVQVRKGERLEFGATVHRTTRAGRLRALASETVTGRRVGQIVHLSRNDYYSGKYPAQSVSVAAGEMVDYLQHRAEGTCFVRVRGEVVDASPCPQEAATAFALETTPEIEWWIEYLVEGRSQGWLLVDGKDVREGGRTFQPGSLTALHPTPAVDIRSRRGRTRS